MTGRAAVERLLGEHRLLDYPTMHCTCNHMALSGYGSVARWEAHLAGVVAPLLAQAAAEAAADVKAAVQRLIEPSLPDYEPCVQGLGCERRKGHDGVHCDIDPDRAEGDPPLTVSAKRLRAALADVPTAGADPLAEKVATLADQYAKGGYRSAARELRALLDGPGR